MELSVWFDANISSGEAFNDEIDREARSAKAILVCWSPDACSSRWVKAESMIAFEADKLAGCYVRGPDKFSAPAPFNASHWEDLRTWLASPSESHSGWKSVLRRIGKLCGREDLISWGKMDAHATEAELRTWLEVNQSSPIVPIVAHIASTLIREREERRRRLESEQTKSHYELEIENKLRETLARNADLERNQRSFEGALRRSETQEFKIKALAREAMEERQRAEDANRAKSAFLANMSYEMRTPLDAIIGFSEIMANELLGPIGNDRYSEYARDIYDSGNHLLELINDILDMAKIEAGKLTLTPVLLEPLGVIEEAVRLIRRRADDKGLSIVIDAKELPVVEADRRALKQMLLNLLSNAVKFTDEGAVMIHARTFEQGLTLRVVDTGCGIPSEHLPRLAQPFQQVAQESVSNKSGTGLGLALAKSLAEMHGGKLSIQSELAKGTIVTVWLPKVFGGARP
jgi:signal transduction histidine kinase